LKRCLEQQQFYKHFIIDDVGFTDEVKFIVNFVGPDNCHLIRIHRAGFEFRGDNRNYISLPGVQTLDLNNNGDPDEMLDTLAAEFRAAEPPTLDTL
jgi:hypothetical protein